MASESVDLIKPNITILNKKYLVLNFISSLPGGGMYYGQIMENQKVVYLKIFHDVTLAVDSDFVALEDEYYQFVEVLHPVLQKPLELIKVELDGVVFPVLVLEKPEGATAKNSLKIEEGGYFEQNRAMDLIATFCEGLQVLHAAGYVHGHINSDNVLITPDDKPVLLNIPFIHKLESPADECEGQNFYRAPELFDDEKPDIKTDIYAVGCLLHEFLVGSPPFLGEDQEDMHREEECPGLNGVPSVVNKLMLKCLEKNRGARHAEFEVIIKALRKAYRAPSAGGGKLKPLLGLVILILAGGGLYFSGFLPVGKTKKTAPVQVVDKPEKNSATKRQPEAQEEPVIEEQAIEDETDPGEADGSETSGETVRKRRTRPNRRSRDQQVTEVVEIVGEPVSGMAFFKGGEFDMGGRMGEWDAPVHRVRLSPFYMDLHEVTNEDYKSFVEAGEGSAPINNSPSMSLWQGDDYPPEIARQPVINVDWHSANDYCNHAGKRLPTEAEWEFAARGIGGTNYPWGNAFPTEAMAQFDADWDGAATLYEVDFFTSGVTPEGIFNMFGGVREWVSDWYDEAYYEKSPPEDPQGPENGEHKVLRGASWEDPEDYNSIARARELPDTRRPTIGFRCAKSWVPPVSEAAEQP
jgi:formylglycine-generating enzyme required for sulfatase activity